MRMNAKPFLKWVGGKGQLLSQLESALPESLYHNEFTYIEPFVGGGAMLFFILQKFSNIKRVIINDINTNLTEAYKNVKYKPRELVLKLKDIEREYLSITTENGKKDFYLKMRFSFNNYNLSNIDKTTLLLFLNRTCFNGLYRENSKGEFNVPFGRYSNPTICNEDVIYADSELLNQYNVEIMNGDFEVISNDDNLTFYYFDPPYRPLSETSNFNSYVKGNFDDNEQKRLACFCQQLSQKDNCLWMLSNSDCSSKNPDDLFFENLYYNFNIMRVYASRSVNADATKRGKLSELLITNDMFVRNNQIAF